MEISAEEIKEFWRGYCERRNIPKDVVARGEIEIDRNPEYWADRTMDELQRLVMHGAAR